jgi:hypothetical protein
VSRKWFLTVTAVGEAGTGAALLALPLVVLELLFGVTTNFPETVTLGRVLGAALVAVGLACWVGRNDPGQVAKVGLPAALLIYDAAAAILLAYAGAILDIAGILLWPAVALHAMLAIWCLICLRLG